MNRANSPAGPEWAEQAPVTRGWGQHTFEEMSAADRAISPALDASLETAATSAANADVSAVACVMAALTAAEICAGVGDEFVGWEAPSLLTAAAATLRFSICVRRAAAAGGTAAFAADTLADPERVAKTPDATREQLRVAMGYAAARTDFSPLRAAAVPVEDDDLRPCSAAFDLRTRTRAASVLSAAARAGSVVAGEVVVADDVVATPDDVVVEDVVDVVGVAASSAAAHPPRRQTASAAVPNVLRCIARTPHHCVDVCPRSSSHPGAVMSLKSADPHRMSQKAGTDPSEPWKVL
jgi:hypothetical protein